MRILLFAGLLLAMAGMPLYAAQDEERSFALIQNELQKKGMTSEDIEGVREPVMDMLRNGASRPEIERPLMLLAGEGVRGEEFKESAEAMEGLVRDGHPARVAGNVVSRAAGRAHSQGLRGRELAEEVHKAAERMREDKRESRDKDARERHRVLEDMGSRGHSPERMEEEDRGWPERGEMMRSDVRDVGRGLDDVGARQGFGRGRGD